jgi:TolB-like protein/Flp pilus assembly protein TadD
MSEFFQRLKERKLVQWAVAYVAAAFALLQGIDIIASRFGWPDWIERAFIIASCIGFFVVVVLAWYHGERGAQRIAGVELVILTLLLSLGGFVLWHFAGGSARPALTSTVGGPNDNKTPPAAIPEKSIAVLPFENLSDEKANAYFANGIQDEILTRLAKIGALKVISRTSTSHYASSPDNLPEIARQLGVANLLEGSVQKAENMVHINVQLIRAATDDHLWAESYDRELKNIFSVEGEVAEAIAVKLNATLSGKEKESVAAQPTNNSAAYDAYLHGLEEDNRTFGAEQLKTASRFYAQAVQLDPNFALAWGHGSNDDGLIYFQAFDHSAARLEAARHGAEMAMRLAPESGEAWLAKGDFLYHIVDYDGAAAAYEEAARRLPNNPEVVAAQAYLERRRGHYDRACELLEQSLERDPQNISVLSTLGETLTYIGRPAEGRQWFDRGLTFRPGDTFMTLWKGSTYMSEANLEAAGKLIEPLPPQLDDATALGFQVNYLTYRRNYSAIVKTMQAAMSQPGFELNGWTSNFYPTLGWAQRRAGDEVAARATFTEGREKLESLRASRSDNGYLATNLALIEAGLGNPDAAQREAERGVELPGKDQYTAANAKETCAVVPALCGRNDQALTALEALAKEPIGPDLGDLRYSPWWDNLRGDPRFQKLIDKVEAATKEQQRVAGP